MKMLYVGTQGSNDPTQAAFPFVFSKGAIEAGHEPTIFLSGEATSGCCSPYAAQRGGGAVPHTERSDVGVLFPMQSDLWADIVKSKVPVFV